MSSNAAKKFPDSQMSSNAAKKPFKPPVFNKSKVSQSRFTPLKDSVIITTNPQERNLGKKQTSNVPDFIDLKTLPVKTTQPSTSRPESQVSDPDSCPTSRSSSRCVTPIKELVSSVPWGIHVTPKRGAALQEFKKKLAAIAGSPTGSERAKNLNLSNSTIDESDISVVEEVPPPVPETQNSFLSSDQETDFNSLNSDQEKDLMQFSRKSNSVPLTECEKSITEFLVPKQPQSRNLQDFKAPKAQLHSSNAFKSLNRSKSEDSLLHKPSNIMRKPDTIRVNILPSDQKLAVMALSNVKVSAAKRAPVFQKPENPNPKKITVKGNCPAKVPQKMKEIKQVETEDNRKKVKENFTSNSKTNHPPVKSKLQVKENTNPLEPSKSQGKQATTRKCDNSLLDEVLHSVAKSFEESDTKKEPDCAADTQKLKNSTRLKQTKVTKPFGKLGTAPENSKLTSEANYSKLNTEIVKNSGEKFVRPRQAKVMKPQGKFNNTPPESEGFIDAHKLNNSSEENNAQQWQTKVKKSQGKSNIASKESGVVFHASKLKNCGGKNSQKRQNKITKPVGKLKIEPKQSAVDIDAPKAQDSRERSTRKRKAANMSSSESSNRSSSKHGNKHPRNESDASNDQLVNLAASKAGKTGRVPRVVNGTKLSQKERLLALHKLRDVGLWIQCCNAQCSKWRYVHEIKDPIQVPRMWYCRNNSDPNYNTCSKPEQKMTPEEEDDLIETKFTAGSVVWARVFGFPFWPAMVEDDPELEQFYWLHDDDPQKVTYYHVTFFDSKAVTRAWVTTSSVKPFSEIDSRETKRLAGKHGSFSARINDARKEASAAMKMTNSERLAKYSFITRYTGPIKKKKVASPSLKTDECSSDFSSASELDTSNDAEDDVPIKSTQESEKSPDPCPINSPLKYEATTSGLPKSNSIDDLNESKKTYADKKNQSKPHQEVKPPSSHSEILVSEPENIDRRNKAISASIFDTNDLFDNEVSSSQDIIPDIPLKASHIVLSPVMDDMNHLTPEDIGALSQGDKIGGIFDSVTSGFQRLSQTFFGVQETEFEEV